MKQKIGSLITVQLYSAVQPTFPLGKKIAVKIVVFYFIVTFLISLLYSFCNAFFFFFTFHFFLTLKLLIPFKNPVFIFLSLINKLEHQQLSLTLSPNSTWVHLCIHHTVWKCWLKSHKFVNKRLSGRQVFGILPELILHTLGQRYTGHIAAWTPALELINRPWNSPSCETLVLTLTSRCSHGYCLRVGRTGHCCLTANIKDNMWTLFSFNQRSLCPNNQYICSSHQVLHRPPPAPMKEHRLSPMREEALSAPVMEEGSHTVGTGGAGGCPSGAVGNAGSNKKPRSRTKVWLLFSFIRSNLLF